MAVANTKSTILQNNEASPIVKNDTAFAGGRVRRLAATVEVAAADDDTSVYRFFRVHSSWSILSLQLATDAITGGTDYDIGLHNINSGAAVDENCYVNALDISGGITITEERFHTLDINTVNQKVYADAGLSADPNLFYDLTATGATVGTAAGTITIIILYTDGT